MRNHKLKIDVYESNTNSFLGSRYTKEMAIFNESQQLVSNSDEINELVKQVRTLRRKEHEDIHFKTTNVKICQEGDTVRTPYGIAEVTYSEHSTMSIRVKHKEAKTPVTDFRMEDVRIIE